VFVKKQPVGLQKKNRQNLFFGGEGNAKLVFAF
jgi:hypothetical protein